MANALSIAAVTAVLRDLLNDGLINHNLDGMFEFQVTTQPPDRLTANGLPANLVNLYLYRVTPNTGWTNLRQPSRSSTGERTANPFLALDLHYILSATGAEDLVAETLLGYAMLVLHDTPVLDRELIRQSLGPPAPVDGTILPQAFQQLAAADLADQFEQIKISPFYTDLEELSKIWTAINTPLRTSVFYQVSVVLIESERSARSALPVRHRGIYVRQLKRPRIARLLSRADPGDAPQLNRRIEHGDQLLLEGHGLRGEITRVRVGDVSVSPTDENITDRRIAVDIPAALLAGVTGVQVVHTIAKESPATGEMPGETSNLAPFVLSPTLAAVDPIALIDAQLVDNGDPTGPIDGVIRINFAHNVGRDQLATLLLSEFEPPADRRPFEYGFRAVRPPANVSEVTQLDFNLKGVRQATYLVRVRVDGAETALGFDGTQYNQPTLLIQP